MKKLAPLACALLLTACGESDVQQVRTWMKETEVQTKPTVKPLQEPKTFVPFAYVAGDVLDPFNASKLLAELAKSRAGSSQAPDQNRRKEFLESFPLDAMKMVGTMEKSNVMNGLVQIDRTVYQVKKGQYVGQNYGLITAVTDDAITVREIVQDAAGDWVERMSKLELQESKESSK
ncbi:MULTISPECIES: pilus assembly protein PilP [unclassified Duganella]|uniref:pilus assembly protein PilP n=1 Tax=unclassified Duganella TaxID=2636909 RepID=UPI0006F49FBA|nr:MULTISPECIES: pilus assembly protein PilP [unclassified Duganella]KQV44690.1 pilus assembly protein PilP [Duganella sp. Root336D2]KRB83212.1 pilus assembly protein PilP [Duganella sp. Root198D2]